jgi:hypothetical protein
VHTEHAQARELRDHFHGKAGSLVMVGHDGEETVVDEAAHGRPNESLLLRQEIVEAIEIDRF